MENRKMALIIDGSSLLSTSYYATLPAALRRMKHEEERLALYPRLLPRAADGRYCNAAVLFLRTLFQVLKTARPTHVAVCWDVSRDTFRRRMWPSYKMNRNATPEPLAMQFALTQEVCEKIGIAQFMDPEYEADDFAGALAARLEKEMPVRILTRDKDYFQLITPRTRIWYGMADGEKLLEMRKRNGIRAHLPVKGIEVDEDILLKEFGYTPSALPMIKALSGDTSDNFPGVHGVGENRAKILAMHYSTPAALYAQIDKAARSGTTDRLRAQWAQWGIRRSLLGVLTRPAVQGQKSAREMAELCYEIGKIRTDMDLDPYFFGGYHSDALRPRRSLLEMRQIASSCRLAAPAGREKRKGGKNGSGKK